MAQRPTISIGAARTLRYKAVIDGGTCHLHGDCSSPATVELRGAGSPLLMDLGEEVDWYQVPRTNKKWFVPGKEPLRRPPPTATVVVSVRCRKCAECLEKRRKQWTAKAIVEVRQAARTWFGTLTVGPDRRFWAKARAMQVSEMERCERWGMLTPIERTREIARVLMPEVTRFLKRVRKESGARIRYLLVVEPHKDGFPHFHILVHELGQPVAKRLLERQWNYGFSKWNLIDAGSVREVGYVCKYISKSAQARIRSSQRYGQADIGLITERVRDALGVVTNTQRDASKTVPSGILLGKETPSKVHSGEREANPAFDTGTA